MFQKTQSSVKVYSQTQRSMVSTAMLTAGIGFLLTCLVGYLVSLLWEKLNYGTYYEQVETASNLNTLYTISGIGIFVSMIMSLIWTFKINSASYGLAFTTMGIYCLSQGVGFGSLFYVFELREILIVFGMVGFILIFCYSISKIITAKTAMTLGKIAFIGTIGYLFGALILSLISLFVISPGTVRTIMLISTFLGGFLSVIYIIYVFWMLQRTNEFLQEDETLRRKIAIFFGFQILVELICLIWRIASLILYFKD